MAFRDRKSSRDEREKARREERRKALTARLGGRPDQPGRSEAEREERRSRREAAKEPAKAKGAKEAKSAPLSSPAKAEKSKPAAEKPKAAPSGPKASRRQPGRRERGSKPSRSKERGTSRQDRAKALRGQGASAAKTGGKALRDGAAATRRRAKAAQPKVAAVGRRSWALAAPLLAIPFLALAFAQRGIRGGLQIGGRLLAAAAAFLDRHVTPGRAVLLVVIATAACLIVSQSQDYRGVEVGQPGYIDVEQTVSADQVDLRTPSDAHGPWLIVLGALAIAAGVAAAVTRRRALGLVVSAAGLAGLLVSLIGDRPEGLDASGTAMAYSGTNAVLLDGFYAQVAACGVLIAAGLLVALYAGAPARRSAKSPRRERGRRARPRPQRSVAESGA